MEVLNEQAEICKRRHTVEKSNLERIIHHLNYQREGKGESIKVIVKVNEISKKPNGVRPAIRV